MWRLLASSPGMLSLQQLFISTCIHADALLYVVCYAAGTVKRGVISPNTNLLLGPDIGDGSFKAAAIKSIVSTDDATGQGLATQDWATPCQAETHRLLALGIATAA